MGKWATKIPPLYTEFCKRLLFRGKTGDFGADTSDFHSDYASDFRTESNNYASDFRDFLGDFGGAPRTAKHPQETPESAPPEQADPRQGNRRTRTAESWRRKR